MRQKTSACVLLILYGIEYFEIGMGDDNILSEKQKLLLTWWAPGSPYRNYDGVICDGAIRSGKTTVMALSFFYWSFFSFDDTNFALCARTRNSVINNLLPVIRSAAGMSGMAVHEKLSSGLVTVTCRGRENRYLLFGANDERSAALIQGLTLGGVLLDEATLMPQSFVSQATARCSPDGARLWFNCNPEGPYHWLCREYIKKAREKNLLRLRFSLEDNPSLGAAVIERYRRMYSGAFYDRFILGEWAAADGLVYPDAARGEFCAELPYDDGVCLISVDYGTRNPFSAGMWKKCGGTWYRTEEYYFDSEREGMMLTDEEYYAALSRFIGKNRVIAVCVDPSAASFIECIRRKGEMPAVPARNDVMTGIREVASALREKRIAVCPGCREAMREFNLYRGDSVYDRPKKENDHAMDDIRYFVSTFLCAPERPVMSVSVERGEW